MPPRSCLLLLFFIPFLTNTSSISQSMAQTDELATLLEIKQDWGNPSALSSWSSQSNASYCSWAGVGCKNGQVSALSLQTFNLNSSVVPASICDLKNLSRLDLSYNNLTGQFPTALYSCLALRFLDLSNNLFSGALPAGIDRLSPAMEHLNLSSNGFSGSVPSAIAAFPKLKSLLLDSNGFNGTYPGSAIGEGLSELETLTLAHNPFVPGPIPDDFGNLTKLTMLWMSKMNLTGGIPDALSPLTELTTLALSENNLRGEIPAWIWNLQKLEILYLYANSFTGPIGPKITAFSIKEVDLSSNMLTGPIPDSIGNTKNLTLLFLYFNNIAGPIPASVGLLPNLFDIRIFGNKLSGHLPPELGKHSPLANLEVGNNLLTGELPDTLCYNKKLYDIVVFNNSFSGEFPAVLADCCTVNNIMAYNNNFTGEFPQKIWSEFPTLTTVMIQNNSFTGTLPRVIPRNITLIQMGNNKFSGDLPASAPGLKTFLAENNQFSGELPADMSGFASLSDLDLSGNMISGPIPASVGSLTSVNSFNLSSNRISGGIPTEIGLLPGLTILDLSNNELSGEIPPDFNSLRLVKLNLSSNQLTGEVPESLQNAAFEEAFLRNRGLCATVNTNLSLPACGHNQMPTGLIILFSVLAGVAVVGAAGCFVVRRKKRGRDLTTWKMTPFHKVGFTECDILTQLREEDVIGSGGSGKVYRVHLRGGAGGAGAVVAVKKLWSRGKAEEKLDREFESEVRILGAIRHSNIVSLLCYISSEDTKLLVYEYMENGSLDRWLHPKEPAAAAAAAPLGWPTRLCIAIDAARGLSYMHEECAQAIMHRDVKSSNILLDPAFRAKIADFGLARILVNSGEPESVSAVGGTFGYMAPECGRGMKVNEKVDVYSFGVVLLELVTGRVANDNGADCCLVEWAWRRYKAGGALHDVVDESIQDRAVYVDDAVAVFLLGVMCTGDDAPSRPSMKQVLQQLSRYDRTASVAGACRDGPDVVGAQLPKGKQGIELGDKRTLDDDGACFWDGDQESGHFQARPV